MRWVLTITTDGRRAVDGRPLLAETLASFREMVDVPKFSIVVVDDSMDAEFSSWVDDRFAESATIVHHHIKGGLSGAVQSAWAKATELEPDFVFHLEDDWRFVRPVDLAWLAAVCDGNDLAQMALKRAPVNPAEDRAGGFMEANPGQYVQRDGWVESSWGFTLNPCVVPGWVIADGWERGWGEREWSDAHPAARFGLWGTLGGRPHIEHIGRHRSPAWKL